MDEQAPTGPTPRPPREQVRRRLLAAAERVFAERGYTESRLQDIAHAAGFTKGAIYSNFGSKQGLFGAVLGVRAEDELVTLTAEIRAAGTPTAAAGRVARVIAQRIVNDTDRGRLGLEFAARAARDEQTREVLTPLRRGQRTAAAESLARDAGERLRVSPALAAMILHCLTNGLSMEHLADPATVTAEAIEQALATVLSSLIDLANGPDAAAAS